MDHPPRIRHPDDPLPLEIRDISRRINNLWGFLPNTSYRHSRQIRDFLLDHLGLDKADFNRSFDLPFLTIAEDPALQMRFFGLSSSAGRRGRRMSLQGRSLNVGDLVRHTRFGTGKIRLDEGETVVVRFDDGLQECDKGELEAVATPLQEVYSTRWHSPIAVVTRAQAAAIESVNDMWGVLSASRIALLPHQLWVCRHVLKTWPSRWLVADDVGLGKTIEAGLVFWSLIAKGTVRRLLIICPASLVEQWHERLRAMFDIRVAIYADDADTERTDFWGTHDKVAVSLQTLRVGRMGRHRRLLESEPWDLVVVDEAHQLKLG